MKNIQTISTLKPQILTKEQRLQFSLSCDLKSILVGLLLGDLYARKQKRNVNARLCFEQGLVHETYLFHLYDLFKTYCQSAPKISNRLPDKRNGKIYTRVTFTTYALPCFNELYDLFYPEGKKVIPGNIGDLLMPSGLAYWICDDGYWHGNGTILSTNSFTLEEVNILVKVLTEKFDLKCSIFKKNADFMIRISSKSVPELQNLLSSHMPSMMKYKIGL